MNRDVVSLEIAKKLQEVGYKGKCLLYFDGNNDIFEPDNPETNQYAKIPAPTATQLAEELPMNVKIKLSNDNGAWLKIVKENGQWSVYYRGLTGRNNSVSERTVGKTLPDALGLMMCYLIENKLI